MSEITQEYLHHLLHYDQLTGEWTWVNPHPRARNIRAGDRAGTTRPDGRRQISVGGTVYLASRLAWFYMTGVWPEDEVDHENRINSDDRWSNLRSATHSQNMFNREWCERSGDMRGITRDGNGWRVMIANRFLGYYVSLNDARQVRDVALAEWAGPFAITPERNAS